LCWRAPRMRMTPVGAEEGGLGMGANILRTALTSRRPAHDDHVRSLRCATRARHDAGAQRTCNAQPLCHAHERRHV